MSLDSSASAQPGASPRISIPQLRRLLLIVLVVAVVALTGAVFVLLQRIFQNFGPGVETDLVWKTVRGAQELSRAVDLGLAVGDAKMVEDQFGDYRRSEDVLGIVALNADGKVLARHGELPEAPESLFSGPAVTERRTPGYLVAWAPAQIEGGVVGKVAIVVKTKRLVDARSLLKKMSVGTGVAGALALLFGLLFVNFFTRSIIDRDKQLAAYAEGLEKKVAERTVALDAANQGMRLVLDNVEQGFITIDREGRMAAERSTIVGRWFGTDSADGTFSQMVSRMDDRAATWFNVGWESLLEGIMPRALLIDQLPKQIIANERTLRVNYIALGPEDSLERLLIVLSDVTEELARERIERDAREMTRAFQRIAADRTGFEQFFRETGNIVKRVSDGAEGDVDAELEKRLIHTVKGNCNIFGIDSVAQACHEVETRMEDEGRRASEADKKKLGNDWDRVARLISGLLGDKRSTIELEQADYQRLLESLRSGMAGPELVSLVESWRLEPVALRLSRLAEKAKYMARRIGKSVAIHVDGGGLRLEESEWSEFWSGLVHAVNNALDHGIEDKDRRREAGKPEIGNIWLTAIDNEFDLVISLRDDGAGVNWEGVASKARKLGIPSSTREDLVAALFCDGMSTRESATVLSGRGVGMGALKEAATAHGGHINVVSEAGEGTTVSFSFPGYLRRRGALAA